MTKTLRLVLGDQLTPRISSLSDAADGDVLLFAEVMEEATYAPHHMKKLAFVFSAMRHFAADRRRYGHDVDYVTLDDDDNTGTLRGEVERAIVRHKPDRIVLTEAGEWRLFAQTKEWEDAFGIPVEIREDTRFFISRHDFRRWAAGRKSPRMEAFYRHMRKREGILLDHDGAPEGGKWNYDAENRAPLPDNVEVPDRMSFHPDPTTRAVLELVEERFADNFGDLDGFDLAVTRRDAGRVLSAFIDKALADFGTYQDAMRQGEPYLFHGRISTYLNAGLLDPREVCARAETAWREGKAPLNAVEGFIRQILGWREYVRGIYWLEMPAYAETNYLNARRRLPDFYWTGETAMNCVRQVVEETRANAYAHHIQRLMITGNFALLAGVKPKEIERWYLAVYSDAYEWVELPNTHGMAVFADGGTLATKPYAASGQYINRMSDYCGHCRYNVRTRNGANACPFNYLYWDFLMRNREKLKGNRRLVMPYRTLARMNENRRKSIKADAKRFLDALHDPPPTAEER